MRVAFLGKGGSGKTTLTTAFIKFLEENNEKVLGVDTDINAHLDKAFDLNSISLSDNLDTLKAFLEPNMVERKIPVISSTPANSKSTFVTSDFNSEFYKKFSSVKNNLALLKVGTLNNESVGAACFHESLATIILIYNRLLDDNKLYVVSDMTAGVDAVGTSMFCVSDINIFVVEPTKKSIQILKDFEEITKNNKGNNLVIVNKVESEEDKDFIGKHIDNKMIIGYIKSSSNINSYEQGDVSKINEFMKENEEIFKEIKSRLDSHKKDWESYFNKSIEIYKKGSDSWFSILHNQDLTKHIEYDFKYENFQ